MTAKPRKKFVRHCGTLQPDRPRSMTVLYAAIRGYSSPYAAAMHGQISPEEYLALEKALGEQR